MNTREFKPTSRGGRWLGLVIAFLLVAGLVFIPAPTPAWAWPPIPIDDDEEDPLIPPPDFSPPANGFTWSVPPRYGTDRNLDRLVDTHWNASTFRYDENYIYPDHWPMEFQGCQTAEDYLDGVSTTNTYTWQIGQDTITGGACYLYYRGFTQQGTYPVTLTYTPQGGTPVTFPQQQVYIKDYLLVAIGDSLASGEGNPDIPQPIGADGWPKEPPTWQDKRCHRTANAYPSKAAIALEFSDPHTSVTFISFACSGASIGTGQWDPKVLGALPPFIDLDPDATKPRGTGVLGPYIGNEWSDYDYRTFVPGQMYQLQTALTPPAGKEPRRFDALIMSAGGNDLHFGDLGMACLFNENCWPGTLVHETPSKAYNMEYLVWRALNWYSLGGSPTSLPDSFAKLDAAIRDLQPQPLSVYITQYADQTRADTSGDPAPKYCRMLDDIFTPLDFAATPQESMMASLHIIYGLNHAILDAATLYGWQYVDGITSYEVDPDPSKPAGTPGPFVRDENGNGHGYCTSDNWIVRADESELIQGPYPLQRFLNKGTLHPNGEGIQVLKDRLLYYLLPNLGAQPPSAPPTFSTSFTSGELTSEPGANGWFVRSCDSDQNCLPQVVLRVTATGATPLLGASVSINGQAGCGDICTPTVDGPMNQVRWDFAFTADGIYQMQFSARDSDNQIADYVAEIKVDLHDPVFDPLPGPFGVDEGSSATLSAEASDYNSAVLNYDWDLDNDGIFETADEQPSFSAVDLDGPEDSQIVRVRVTDHAGRTATTQAAVNVLNVAPTAAINGAPETSSEGTAINLTSSVSDPGVDDTFYYVWSVKKNGSDYASGSNADFGFTPDDNGSYEVSLKVEDDDDGVAATSQIIEVENVAPALSGVTASPGTVDEGSSVTLGGSISDAGSADAFALTIDWGDGSTPDLVPLPAGSTSFSRSHTYADDNPTGTASDTYPIALTVFDDDGGTGTGSASAVVNNLPPSLSISAPESGALYAVHAAVDLSASLTDPSSLDALACSVNWDDGNTGSGTLAAGVCTASHVYAAPGVYTIQVTGADDDTGAKAESVMVVVYDPSAGFVTGGGWINSPAGAYKADESLSGKATFGFVSRYQKGASVPTGNTAFKFEMGGLEFYSTAYEWLVVNQGGTNAQFKGSGLINGIADPNGAAYKFMLWAGDGAPDTFRIRIWWEAGDVENVVYDNGTDQAIGAGNIVVHTSK